MVLCNLPYRLREIAGRIAKKCQNASWKNWNVHPCPYGGKYPEPSHGGENARRHP